MPNTIAQWIIADLRRDLARIEMGKLAAAPYIWMAMLAYLATDFNSYAALTGQTWRVGQGDLCAAPASAIDCADAIRQNNEALCKSPPMARLFGQKPKCR